MRQASVRCLNPGGFHSMAYTEWGEASNPRVLVCVHGLSRNGRDFDAIARALAGDYRIVCPDVAGRGRSDNLPDAAHYTTEQYCADMTVLIARLGVESVDWLGTSMGGLIGMTLAARRNTPLRRLILNDIGPLIAKEGIERIRTYIGNRPVFDDVAAAADYIAEVNGSFGPLRPEQWFHLAEHSVRPRDGGGYELRLDPAVATSFMNAEIADVDLWPVWDSVACPVMVLRGRDSIVLRAETAAEMTRRGAKATLVEFDRVGHAPALMDDDQIAPVAAWLRKSA